MMWTIEDRPHPKIGSREDLWYFISRSMLLLPLRDKPLSSGDSIIRVAIEELRFRCEWTGKIHPTHSTPDKISISVVRYPLDIHFPGYNQEGIVGWLKVWEDGRWVSFGEYGLSDEINGPWKSVIRIRIQQTLDAIEPKSEMRWDGPSEYEKRLFYEQWEQWRRLETQLCNVRQKERE